MKRSVASLLLPMFLCSPALPAIETLVAAVQPVISEVGLEPTVSTYSVYIGDGPGLTTRMQLTVAPNAIVSSGGGPADRNLGSARGIRFGCAERGDSLVVRVDLSGVKRHQETPETAKLDAQRLAEEVSLTLWCGLRNARAAWPSVRYVCYE